MAFYLTKNENVPPAPKMEDEYEPLDSSNIYQLIIMCGFPGCGKSSFVKKYGLEPYTLSLDTLRLMMSEPIAGVICQDFNQEVGGIFEMMLRTRLNFGRFTVIDNTNLDTKSLEKCVRYAKYWHCYDVTLFDFTKAIPMETALDMNERRRGSFRHVPEGIFQRMEQNRLKDINDLNWKIDRVVDLGSTVDVDGKCEFYVHDGNCTMLQVEKFLREVVPYKKDMKRAMKAYEGNRIPITGEITSEGGYDAALEMRKHGLL